MFAKGGNWMSCDRRLDLYDRNDSQQNLNVSALFFSESQKCCLFNMNNRGTFLLV